MALPDPITVAASAPNPELKYSVVKFDAYGSERIDTNGGGYTLNINHTKGKNGNRHYIQTVMTKDVTNPYTGATQKQNASISSSIARPLYGFSDADMTNLHKAHTDTVADTEVTAAKLIQFQS